MAPTMQRDLKTAVQARKDMVLKRPAAAKQKGDHAEACKVLLSSVWSEMDEEAQKEVLERVKLPDNIYRQFHSSMRTHGHTMPKQFVDEYTSAMSKETRRGTSSGKRSQLQDLCKQWLLEVKDHTGDDGQLQIPKNCKFDTGFMCRYSWSKRSQATEKQQKLYPWGIIAAKHGGEELAIAAMNRSEIKKVCNPDWVPGATIPKFMYNIVLQVGPKQ